jgi:glycosyltransferase involved in cell wall biosynthesis
MKTASIIIPTFNRAHLVVRAIESAINQTYPCEIVLCDHGSKDNTPDVAAQYEGKIRYIRREEDRGPIVAWRDGIEQAKGEIVHINYDDDWMKPEFMEKTIANVIMYHEDGSEVFKGCLTHPPDVGRIEDIVKYLLQTQNPLTISPGCAIFRRKDALKNLLLQIPNAKGIYGKNSGVGEDLLLFLLTSFDYPKNAYIPEPLACFLSHPGSITVDAILSGKLRDIADSYANAKSYYFSLPGSIPPPTKLQKLFFTIKWDYRSGTLVQNTLRFIMKKLRNMRQRLVNAGNK